MKLRSLFIFLGAIVLVFLLISASSLYWILAQSPLTLIKGGVTREPIAAVLVPKQAPLMVSLLVNPERLESFSQLIASPANRRRSHNELQDLEKSLLANTGLNYQKEIKPWLGEEITLAVTSLDFDRNRENGIQPGYLLAIATKDAELAKEFLQQSYTKGAIEGKSDLVFEPYKGVNIVYQRPLVATANNRFLASTVIADFVLFANDPKILRTAINNIQAPDLNLKNSSEYQEALKTILNPRIGVVYANLPTLSAWIANAPVPEKPEAIQQLTATLSLKSQGLVAETALLGVLGAENQSPVLSQPVGALNYVTSDSLLSAAGTNLNQLWTQIETGLEPDSPLQQLLNQVLNRLQTPLGLNLPQEVFSWVRGEYSLALVPDPEGGEPDWLFVSERLPDVDVDAAVAHLDELAKAQGYSVGDLPLLDTTVTAWTKLTTTRKGKENLARLDTIVKGVHTSVDRYEIFASSIEAMSKALSPTKTALAESDTFLQAISALPTANDGYFYLNWHQFEPFIEQKLPIIQVPELALKPLFKNLRSFTLSSQGSQNGIRRATLFFNLGVR